MRYIRGEVPARSAQQEPTRSNLPEKVGAAGVAIRDAIVAGHLRPGDQIDRQDWAERLGLSPQPVTTALEILADEGFVEIHAQSGSFVSRPSLDRLLTANFTNIVIVSLGLRQWSRDADRVAADADGLQARPEQDPALHQEISAVSSCAESSAGAGARAWNDVLAEAEDGLARDAFQSVLMCILRLQEIAIRQADNATAFREWEAAARYQNWVLGLYYASGGAERVFSLEARRRIFRETLALHRDILAAVVAGKTDLMDQLLLDYQQYLSGVYRQIATEMPDIIVI